MNNKEILEVLNNLETFRYENIYTDKQMEKDRVNLKKLIEKLTLQGVGCTCCDKTRKHNDLLKDEFKDDYCNWCDRKIV